MADTFTSRVGLRKPAYGDSGWDVLLNADLDLLDAQTPFGGLAVQLTEVPSTTLRVIVAAGQFRTPWGALVSYAGSVQTLGTASTSSLYLDVTGTLHVSTTGWPGTAYVPIATVVTGATTVTNITDARVCLPCLVPVAQPTLGAATAGASYTATEQGMINSLWSMARSLGFGT